MTTTGTAKTSDQLRREEFVRRPLRYATAADWRKANQAKLTREANR